MTTKQTGLDFLGRTPEELITAGRADSIQSAKRLIEIARLENINYEFVQALKLAKGAIDYATNFNVEIPEPYYGAMKAIEQAISKVQGETR